MSYYSGRKLLALFVFLEHSISHRLVDVLISQHGLYESHVVLLSQKRWSSHSTHSSIPIVLLPWLIDLFSALCRIVPGSDLRHFGWQRSIPVCTCIIIQFSETTTFDPPHLLAFHVLAIMLTGRELRSLCWRSALLLSAYLPLHHYSSIACSPLPSPYYKLNSRIVSRPMNTTNQLTGKLANRTFPSHRQ